ncbi:MAG TPA: CopG family transcriptional regulator, partial [Ktedonobacteraceae bacterium]|nr:CopG family transcriptional regulator [Ktedonobacteraceae bacterium]
MRKERTNIYLTSRQKKQLEQRSQEENLPIAELIRRALDAYLAWDDPTYHPDAPSPKKECRFHPYA